MKVNNHLNLKIGCKEKPRGIMNIKVEDTLHFLTLFSQEKMWKGLRETGHWETGHTPISWEQSE